MVFLVHCQDEIARPGSEGARAAPHVGGPSAFGGWPCGVCIKVPQVFRELSLVRAPDALVRIVVAVRAVGLAWLGVDSAKRGHGLRPTP